MAIVALETEKNLLVPVKVLAPELGISIWTLYSLARENRIPHRRLGRSVKFSRPEIEAWLRGAVKATEKIAPFG